MPPLLAILPDTRNLIYKALYYREMSGLLHGRAAYQEVVITEIGFGAIGHIHYRTLPVANSSPFYVARYFTDTSIDVWANLRARYLRD